MCELRRHLGFHQVTPIETEAEKRAGGGNTESWSSPSRTRTSLDPSDRSSGGSARSSTANSGARWMDERPASAWRELKNPPDRAGVSASRPARPESPEFALERERPCKAAGLPHREFENVREVDPDGRIVIHSRLIDSLGRLLRSGAINQAMYDAARAFHTAFIVANLDPIRAAPVLRVPGAGRAPDLNDRQIVARRRVHQAMQALGGMNSPASSCVWHVLGCGCSIREWALRQGWCGRSVDQKEAKGVLIAALGMLAGHYGYSEIGGRPQLVQEPK